MATSDFQVKSAMIPYWISSYQRMLASHQEKVYDVDDHMGMCFSGLTADARFICKFMRNECLNYWYTHGSVHPVERLINKL